MGAQGYDIKQKILFQDNQSEINMEKTGRGCALETPGTLIYVTSLLKKHYLKQKNFIACCITENMIADFFTISLQGALFAKFRDVIMGWKEVDTL